MTRASDRRYALVAGLALLLMSVLAAVAILGVVDPIVASDDVAAEIRDAGSRFDLAVAGLVAIALLDLVIAWALWRLFTRSVDRRLAGLAGAARAAYAVVSAVAIGFLATAEPASVERYQELPGPRAPCLRRASRVGRCALLALAVRASVDRRPRRARRRGLRGRLDRRAGLGLVRRRVAAFLFVGEVALMVWLIWWGLRGGVVSRLGWAALAPQLPKRSAVEVRGASATSLETTTPQPVRRTAPPDRRCVHAALEQQPLGVPGEARRAADVGQPDPPATVRVGGVRGTGGVSGVEASGEGQHRPGRATVRRTGYLVVRPTVTTWSRSRVAEALCGFGSWRRAGTMPCRQAGTVRASGCPRGTSARSAHALQHVADLRDVGEELGDLTAR